MTDAEPETVTVNDAFLERLRAVEKVENRLAELRDEVRDMNLGLDDEDVVRLLYGRPNGLNLKAIEAAFEGLEAVPDASDHELLRRLVSAYGNTTLDDAEKFLAQVNGLRVQYGDLDAEDADVLPDGFRSTEDGEDE